MKWNQQETLALQGKFISSEIRTFIEHNTIQRFTLTPNSMLSLTTYKFTNQDPLDTIQLAKSLVRQATDFQQHYTTTDEPLVVYWFPTPFVKTLPNKKKSSLDVPEINSACTFHYPDNRFITIYRLEEAPKVLYHELIHFYQLDTPLNIQHDNYFISKYKITAPCIFRETYSELVGCLLNLDRVSRESGIPFMTVYTIEYAFMVFQAQKVLDYFNIKHPDELYRLKSDTNLLTYFILKMAFFVQLDDPANYLENLKSNRFVISNPDQIVRDINQGLIALFQLPRIKPIRELLNTMRMTIVEL